MIQYFREGLKPSIKIKIEQQNRATISFKKIVHKAINTKAKADL